MKACGLTTPEVITFLTGVQRIFDVYRDKAVDRSKKDPEGHPHITHDVYTAAVVPEPGRRYIRLVRTDKDGGSRCAYGFIDKTTGDVLMAAGWKAPAKHARGNVFNPDNGINCCGPYGVAYLK